MNSQLIKIAHTTVSPRVSATLRADWVSRAAARRVALDRLVGELLDQALLHFEQDPEVLPVAKAAGPVHEVATKLIAWRREIYALIEAEATVGYRSGAASLNERDHVQQWQAKFRPTFREMLQQVSASLTAAHAALAHSLHVTPDDLAQHYNEAVFALQNALGPSAAQYGFHATSAELCFARLLIVSGVVREPQTHPTRWLPSPAAKVNVVPGLPPREVTVRWPTERHKALLEGAGALDIGPACLAAALLEPTERRPLPLVSLTLLARGLESLLNALGSARTALRRCPDRGNHSPEQADFLQTALRQSDELHNQAVRAQGVCFGAAVRWATPLPPQVEAAIQKAVSCLKPTNHRSRRASAPTQREHLVQLCRTLRLFPGTWNSRHG